MATTSSKHVFEFLGKADSLTKASKQAQKELTTTEKAMGKVGDVAKYALAGVGVAAVGSLVKASVDMAVQAEDAGTKFEAVFAENVEEATGFVEEFANKAGFAEHEMQGMLATTANVAQGLGATGDDALKLSTDLATLAGDVASFNGATSQTPEVLAAMQSALTGEREALKTYGIVIDEADVNTQAFIETGKKSADELTKVEKAQATYTLMVERAGAAVGDLDATADSTSNQMAKLSAEFKDAQVQLGTALVPALGVLVGALSDVTTALDQTSTAADNLDNNLSKGATRLQDYLGLASQGEKNFLAAADGVAHFNQAIADGTPYVEATAEALAGVIALAGPDGAAAAVGAFAKETGISNLRLQDAADYIFKYTDKISLTSAELEVLASFTSEANAEIEAQIASFDSGTAEAQRFAQIGLKAATDEMGDLEEQTEDTRTTLQQYLDTQRAAIDPLFAYTQATRDLRTATQEVDEARRDFGRGSDEHIAAMENQTVAYSDLQAAAATLRSQGLDPTKDAFREMAIQAGLTDEQIRLMEQQWDLWDPASKRLELTPVGSGWTIEPGGASFNAKGGRVKAGEVSVVGEEGPEIVKFGAAGTVIPNDKIPTITSGNGHTPTTAATSAPVNYVFNFYHPVGSEKDLESVVVRSIVSAQARGRIPPPSGHDQPPVRRARRREAV